MNFSTLEVVVLEVELPEHGLRRGDLGTVVEVYPDGLEVEFVTASGRAAAIVSVPIDAVRPMGGDDLMSVRKFEPSADRRTNPPSD